MRPGNGHLAYLPWAYTRPRIGIGVLAPTGGIGTNVSPDRWVGHSFILSCSQSSSVVLPHLLKQYSLGTINKGLFLQQFPYLFLYQAKANR